MDKGAHFYRCDFQVHTPRDIGWIGGDVVSDDERRIYADELVLACRVKGLNAIAITDHHDFTFFHYVKEAAEREVDETNNPISKEHQLVVFPGMELTLSSPPCQAILILDSNFPVNSLELIYPILAIKQNDPKDSEHAHISQLTCARTFGELYALLNRNDFMKDKFIIIPNVSESGNSTLLRSRFSNYYKDMPCVGGYLDGDYSQLGKGNLKILSGKDRNYGLKSLGIFQTSDNRRRDHADLGKSTTWVKWAISSAEALRQACLAKESRISQNEPSLPSIYITSINVSDSKFMGSIFLEFNHQYNSLIGGRGTGKSTILEYLRWGLCDQPPETLKGQELPEYQERRKNLIQKTLIPFNATVQISFMKNKVPHIIKRKSDTYEIFLKIGDEDFEPCKEFDVRNLLPIQAYSQKQLSGVGVSFEELKRLVYSSIRQELNEYNTKFKELSSEIRNCYEIIQSKKLINKEIIKDDLELKSLDEQLFQLKKGLKGLSPKDQQIITAHANYESADEQVKAWQREISTMTQDVKTLIDQLKGYPSKLRAEVKLSEEDASAISAIDVIIKDIFNSINEKAKALEALLFEKNDKIVKVNEEILRWQQIYDEHKTNYENAKKQSTSQEQTLEQISIIEGRLKELRANLAEKKEAINRKGSPEAKFDSLSISWCKLHNSRADIIAKQCYLLNSLSNGNLKANLGRGKGTNNLEEKLKEHFQGAKIQREKIEKLCDRIKESKDSIKEWINLLKELEQLADVDLKEEASTSLPVTPILCSIGFIKSELQRIAEKLTNENWIDLFLIELEDIPIFEYRTKDNEYIGFSDASVGQQATSLMHVLLNQDGPPLIIDQPEEDLDNEMVSDISELIWNAKTRRQIIFASHNANIVVNGDAELVVCCRYLIEADQTKGTIDNQGAIDIPTIKEEITRIMEGGERAFKLRKEKYGF